MFRLPNKVKVGGLEYPVNLVEGLGDYGSTEFRSRVINIAGDSDEDEQLSTLIHELIEIINSKNDLNLTHQTIQTLEHNLFQIYKDNFYAIKKRKVK